MQAPPCAQARASRRPLRRRAAACRGRRSSSRPWCRRWRCWRWRWAFSRTRSRGAAARPRSPTTAPCCRPARRRATRCGAAECPRHRRARGRWRASLLCGGPAYAVWQGERGTPCNPRARQAAPAVLCSAALRSGSFAGSVGAGQRYSSRARAGRSLIAGQGLLCMTCSPSASSTADACTPRASARRSWPTARALTAAPALMKVCAARAVLVALAAVGPRRLRLHAQRQRLPRAEGARRRQLADRAVTCRPCIP